MWQEPCPSARQIMRAAADWQLEQVIEWLKTNTEDYLLEDYYSTYFLTEAFFDGFKKAMRPEVVDLPQANSDVCGEEGMERALQRTFEENDELMRKLSDS